MTTKLGLTDLVNGQANYLNANQTFAILNQLVQGAVVDKDLSAPPGSPADESLYIVAAAATGAWAGQSGKLAFWLSSVGTWTFITPREGMWFHVNDEDEYYRYTGSAWQVFSGGGGGVGAPIRTITGTTGTLTVSDAGKKIECTNSSPVTLTLNAESTAAWPNNTDIEIFQRGAGEVSVVGAGFTIKCHSDDTLVLAGNGAAAQLSRFGVDDWNLVGRLVAA